MVNNLKHSLPSNCSMHIHQDDKILSKIAQLSHPIQLHILKWEATFPELQIPYTFYAMRVGQNMIIKEIMPKC